MSLLLHIQQLQSFMMNLNVEDHHLSTRTTVDDHQLPSIGQEQEGILP